MGTDKQGEPAGSSPSYLFTGEKLLQAKEAAAASFKDVKVGDKVEVTYTEAVMISVK